MKSASSSKPSFRYEALYPWGFLLIMGLGLGLRLAGLGRSIWMDEYFTIRIISSRDMIAQLIIINFEPPLYFVLLKLWSNIGTQVAFLRVFSVILSLGTLTMLMLWMKYYSRLASLLAGFLFASLPFVVRYSQELRPYQLLLLGTAASFYFASHVVNSPSKNPSGINIPKDKKDPRAVIHFGYYLGLAIGLVVTVFAHMIGVMVVASVGFFICTQARFNIKKLDIKKLLIVFSFPVLAFGYIYFIFLPPHMPDTIGSWPYPNISSQLLISCAQTLMGRTALSYGYSQLQTITGNLLGLLPWLLILILIFLVVITLMLGKWKQTWGFLATALFFELIMIVYSLFFLPVLFSNTLLPMLIPAIGFIALQVSSIPIKTLRRIAAAGIITLCVIFSAFWFNVQANIPAEPWRAVASYIKSNANPDDLVIYFPPYNSGPVGYYLENSAPAGKLLVNFVAKGAPGPHVPYGDNSYQINLADTAAIFNNIDSFASHRKDPQSSYQIFLVVREEDPFVLEYEIPYKNLVSKLQEKTASAPLFTNFDGLTVRIFTVKNK